MKKFNVQDMPLDLQGVVWDLPNIQPDDEGWAEFKVMTAPDPEWGNMHVPLALWLIKQGANKGETVLLKVASSFEEIDNIFDEFDNNKKTDI